MYLNYCSQHSILLALFLPAKRNNSISIASNNTRLTTINAAQIGGRRFPGTIVSPR